MDSVVGNSISTEEGLAFDVDPSIKSQELTIFEKTEAATYWLEKIYSPDHLVKSKTDTVKYMIKSVELTDGDYTNAKGKCVSRPVLFVLREKDGEEFYDVHFLNNNDDSFSEKVTYDGTQQQTDGSVSLSTDYKLADDCPTLAVIRSYSGGDIDYGRMREISLFISTESGMVSVFDLVLEDMLAREYEVTGDENKNSTLETSDFEILDKKTNGLRDIKAHTIIKKEGEVTEEKDVFFHFNGEKYVE